MTEEPETTNRLPLVSNGTGDRSASGATYSRRTVLTAIGGGAAAIGTGFGVWIMLTEEERDSDPGLVFVIPAGAANAVGGSTLLSAIEMPTQIRFEKGETAAITIRNEDIVPLRAGPFLVGPGQTYTQRFPAPGEYPIACTVNPEESITVTVL